MQFGRRDGGRGDALCASVRPGVPVRRVRGSALQAFGQAHQVDRLLPVAEGIRAPCAGGQRDGVAHRPVADQVGAFQDLAEARAELTLAETRGAEKA